MPLVIGLILEQNRMHAYKKRLRLFAERHHAKIGYLHNGGLEVQIDDRLIEFVPDSKLTMTCNVATSGEKTVFRTSKNLVFDLVHRFVDGQSLNNYKPKGVPLSLDDYIEEEHAKPWVRELEDHVREGTATNGELGGNHYNAEYYNGILILFDIFTGAPTNVIEFG